MAKPESIVLVASNITDPAVRAAAEEQKQTILSALQQVLHINSGVLGFAVNRFFPEREARQGDWMFEIEQPAVCACGEMYPVSTILESAEPHDNIPGKAILTRPLLAWCPVCNRTVDLLGAKAHKT